MRPIGCVSMLKQENPWRLSYRETMTMIQNPEIWRIRKRIWDLIEARNIAQFPQPVHHRIPNFICASIADKKLNMLEVSLKAECVKLNPDTPQKQVRFLTLHGGFDTAHVAARAYDYVIKFQGLDVDIIFNISDYEEDAKQGGPHLSLFCQKRRAEISALISWFSCLVVFFQ